VCAIFLIEKASVPISITLAFIAGVAATLQAGISGQLAKELNDGIMAALVSNIGGTIFTALFLLNPNVRKQAKKLFKAVVSGNFAKWQLLGGVAGAVYISTASSTVSIIGTGLFTVVLVASQNVSGIIVDKFGFSSGAKRRITPKRALAVVIGIVAVLLSVSEFEGKILWLPILAVVIAGFAVTIQFALNGRVTKASNSQVSAFINFPMSMFAVLTVLIVMNLFGKNWNSWPDQWWLYSAGFLGAVVVFLAAATIRTLGVLLFGLASVAGQLITSIALDVILPNANINVGWALISGAGLMLLAVYLASDLR
jgi:bacterial/archaeal transporter family-2 protein